MNERNGEAMSSAKRLVATANHILYDQNVVDGFGHVSMRHPENPDWFLLSRNLAPALVQPEDVLTVDLDGNVVTATQHKTYLERFIHAEIYRTRPDVNAVVHSHSASMLPFGIVKGLRLCQVCHMGGFLQADTPVFEIRTAAGEGSNMLISDALRGKALARSLGEHSVVLMRGHGVTAVGESVQQAVFMAVYAEANARVQLSAMPHGPIVTLTEAEAQASDEANAGQILRAWDFWARKASIAVAELQAAGGNA